MVSEVSGLTQNVGIDFKYWLVPSGVLYLIDVAWRLTRKKHTVNRVEVRAQLLQE